MFKIDISFSKKVFIVALPIIIQQMIMALAQLVDNLMVGSLGEAAIAGVGASNMLFSIVLYLGFGIIEGCSIFSAQQYGANQLDKLKHTFVTSIYFALLLGILSTLIVGIFNNNLISIFINGDTQVSVDALKLGIDYTKIAIFSYLFMSLSTAIGSSFRAIGSTKFPMFAGIVAIFTNTTLNYILIFGNFGFEAHGVEGAAIATVISRGLELCILIGLMYFNSVEFLPKLKHFVTIPIELFKSISLKVIPLTINEFAWAFGRSAIMALYGARSAEEFAAVQISNTMANLLFVAMSGFSVAVSVVIGQELGRGNLEHAKDSAKKLLTLGFYISLFITIVGFILVFILPLFYNSVSDSTMFLARAFLATMAICFPIYLVTATIFFTLRAGGDAKGVLIMDGIYMWLITVPATFILVEFTDLSILVIYILMQLFDVIKLVIAIYIFKKYNWLKKIV